MHEVAPKRAVDFTQTHTLGTLSLSAASLDTTTGTSLEARKQAFLEKYGVRTDLGESKVEFTLPKDASVMDLLRDAQALARELHGRDAVHPCALRMWSEYGAFNAKASEAIARSIDGNVAESTCKSRNEQVALLTGLKLEMPEMEHLAAAHAAYFIASGKDLFDGNVVRARREALRFLPDGLCVIDCIGDYPYDDGAASADLSPRNPVTP